MKHLPLVIALSLFTLGCGGGNPVSPTTVTPAPTNIAGNWSGTFTFTPINNTTRTVVAVTATFTQAGAGFTGQVNITGGATVQLSGQTTASTLTASAQYTNGACAGSASISGTASSTIARFSIPSIASNGTCTFFTNGDFVLNR